MCDSLEIPDTEMRQQKTTECTINRPTSTEHHNPEGNEVEDHIITISS